MSTPLCPVCSQPFASDDPYAENPGLLGCASCRLKVQFAGHLGARDADGLKPLDERDPLDPMDWPDELTEEEEARINKEMGNPPFPDEK